MQAPKALQQITEIEWLPSLGFLGLLSLIVRLFIEVDFNAGCKATQVAMSVLPTESCVLLQQQKTEGSHYLSSLTIDVDTQNDDLLLFLCRGGVEIYLGSPQNFEA